MICDPRISQIEKILANFCPKFLHLYTRVYTVRLYYILQSQIREIFSIVWATFVGHVTLIEMIFLIFLFPFQMLQSRRDDDPRGVTPLPTQLLKWSLHTFNCLECTLTKNCKKTKQFFAFEHKIQFNDILILNRYKN